MEPTQLDLESSLFWGLWHNSPDNMFILKVQPDDYYIMSTNQSLASTVDQSIIDMNGKPLRSILPPDFWSFVTPNYQRCVDERKPIQYEEEDTFTADTITYWSTLLSPVFGSDGKVEYIFGISRNITDLKHAEQRAQQAAEEAERANRVKTAFLANMSHELRTPLNGIRSATELMAEADSRNEQSELCGLISSATDAMTRLTSDILDYARIDSGHLRMESRPFSLRALCSDVSQLLYVSAHNKGLVMSCHLDPLIPDALVGDAGRIKQVLLNLAGNAIKFTDIGHVDIALRLAQQGDGTIRVQGEVSDTGIGIRQEDIGRLFQAFSQVDDSTTRQYQGTGLGLVICKDLLERMEGWIEVDSEFGKGSTFRFEFQLDVAEQQPDISCTATSQLAEHSDSLAGVKVLLVEDNIINQTVATKLLEKESMEVTIAHHGKAALELCKQRTFDVVLMDWHMPVMDGLEATRAIRQLSWQWQTIPIIALTANALESDQLTCLAAGMNAVITKPMNRDSLFATIRKLLAGQG